MLHTCVRVFYVFGLAVCKNLLYIRKHVCLGRCVFLCFTFILVTIFVNIAVVPLALLLTLIFCSVPSEHGYLSDPDWMLRMQSAGNARVSFVRVRRQKQYR